MRNQNIVASYLLLQRGNRILLSLRQNTGYHDGDFSLIAGHVEAGETFSEAIRREAKEEAGIILLPQFLRVVHVMHRHSQWDGSERVDVFFATKKWNGHLANLEPDKCRALQWFATNQLPPNLVDCVRHTLTAISHGITYSEFGW